MDDKLTSNNIENDGFNINAEDNDYEILIERLQFISSTIALLEKQYSDKF